MPSDQSGRYRYEGHRTDRAILAGLLGTETGLVDTRLMDALADASKPYVTTIQGKTFTVGNDTIVWDKVDHPYPFANTLVMRLVGVEGTTLFEREYYSPGGGFFQWKGQPAPDRGQPVYPYGNMADFRRLVRERNKSLSEIMLENEKVVMKTGEAEIFAHLDLVLKTMEDGVTQGLSEEGLLPGPFPFYRKAKRVYEGARNASGEDSFAILPETEQRRWR